MLILRPVLLTCWNSELSIAMWCRPYLRVSRRRHSVMSSGGTLCRTHNKRTQWRAVVATWQTVLSGILGTCHGGSTLRQLRSRASHIHHVVVAPSSIATFFLVIMKINDKLKLCRGRRRLTLSVYKAAVLFIVFVFSFFHGFLIRAAPIYFYLCSRARDGRCVFVCSCAVCVKVAALDSAIPCWCRCLILYIVQVNHYNYHIYAARRRRGVFHYFSFCASVAIIRVPRSVPCHSERLFQLLLWCYNSII